MTVDLRWRLRLKQWKELFNIWARIAFWWLRVMTAFSTYKNSEPIWSIGCRSTDGLGIPYQQRSAVTAEKVHVTVETCAEPPWERENALGTVQNQCIIGVGSHTNFTWNQRLRKSRILLWLGWRAQFCHNVRFSSGHKQTVQNRIHSKCPTEESC